MVTLASGQTVTVNANGTLTIAGTADTGTFNFTYSVQNEDGVSDTGFVILNAVPCFVAGTLLRTAEGERPVETLRPGDMVMTKDEGPRPLRWVGTREVAAQDKFAPIRIAAGTFGARRDLWLSPEHRIVLRDVLAELMFGEAEVLVAAKHLVNDRTVRRIPGGRVTYVHVMFDRHQLVYAEGIETESFLPGPQTTRSFAPETLAEIRALFPELDPMTGQGYGPAARPALYGREARLLMQRRRVA